jgi:hypothetical protein
MSIIKNALKKEIDNNSRQQYNDTTATILEYSPITNTATIQFTNPNGEGTMYREKVPVANTSGGVTGSGFYPGQPCTITFISNNIYNPVITGVINSHYASKTCSDQGAFIVDENILLTEKPKNISPMIESWLKNNDYDFFSENNHFVDYSKINVTESIAYLLDSLDKYKNTEQGITNLNTKSTIKFKENGDIDIFIANNIGIRISKTDNSISLYGKIKVNGKEIDLSNVLNKEQ